MDEFTPTTPCKAPEKLKHLIGEFLYESAVAYMAASELHFAGFISRESLADKLRKHVVNVLFIVEKSPDTLNSDVNVYMTRLAESFLEDHPGKEKLTHGILALVQSRASTIDSLYKRAAEGGDAATGGSDF